MSLIGLTGFGSCEVQCLTRAQVGAQREKIGEITEHLDEANHVMVETICSEVLFLYMACSKHSERY